MAVTQRGWAAIGVGILGLTVAACAGISATTNKGTTESSPATSSAESPASRSSESAQAFRVDLRAPAPNPADVTVPSLKNGLPPLVTNIDTNGQKIVFLTIDDGYEKDQRILDLFKEFNVQATPFLTKIAIADNPNYYKQVQELTGQHVQDHTLTHPFLTKLSLDGQKKEICGAADTYEQWFATRPWMLRPPYGSSNSITPQAAASCGIDYLVNWDASLPMHAMVFADGGKNFKPGNIILTHWRKDLYPDLRKMLVKVNREGFKIGALQDYLPRR